MKTQLRKYPAILVLTGASGAGKTSLIDMLNGLAIPGVDGINCDRVTIDDAETAEPSDKQAGILRYWITKFREEDTRVAVLDTQIRPHIAQEVLDNAGVESSQIVLVDCDPAIRNERLRTERQQPELANPQMDCWAAYLRGQADALRLTIIQTGDSTLDESTKILEEIVGKLLAQAKTL